MDKNTLSNYGWIVVLILILSVMLALATPFGNFIATGFEATYTGFDYTANEALGTVIGLENGDTGDTETGITDNNGTGEYYDSDLEIEIYNTITGATATCKLQDTFDDYIANCKAYFTDNNGNTTELMYNGLINFFKKALKDIAILLKEIEKAQDRKERQKLIEQLENKIKEYDNEMKKYEEMLGRNTKETENRITPDKIDFDKQIDFKQVCPEMFEELQYYLIDNTKDTLNDYHENVINIVSEMQTNNTTEEKEKFITDKLGEINTVDLCENEVYNEAYGTNRNWIGFFKGYEDNYDFCNLIKEYCNEYEDCNWNDYITEKEIDFDKLMEDTDIEDDILRPFIKQIVEDDKTQGEIKQHISKMKAEHGDIEDLINSMDDFVSEQNEVIDKAKNTIDILDL